MSVQLESPFGILDCVRSSLPELRCAHDAGAQSILRQAGSSSVQFLLVNLGRNRGCRLRGV